MKQVCTFLMICILFLTGCASITSSSLQERLDVQVEKAEKAELSKPDHKKKYYSYYLPSDMGRYESSETGNVLSYNEVKILMSLNVSGIINKSLYPREAETGFSLREENGVAERKGLYTDENNIGHSYRLVVYDLADTSTICMISDTVIMYANCNDINADKVAGRMIQLARTISVNETDLVSDYSNRISEISRSEKVEMFESTAPENGRIEELFEDHSKVDSDQYTNKQFDSGENGSDTGNE